MAGVDCEAAVAFILARRKQTGGFGATPHLPATVEDTFHAVGGLEILGALTGRDLMADLRADQPLAVYLEGLLPGAGLGVKTVFQLHWCCARLGLVREPGWSRPWAGIFRPRDLVSLYYETLLRKAMPPVAVSGSESGPDRLAAALAAERMACQERLMRLEIERAAGGGSGTENRPELVRWFQDCQNPDGGFGFFPSTTSYIENSHFCLKALALLGAAPRDPAGAGLFISACQTRSGGFGRRANAAPFLDSTFHALSALKFLAV